MLLSIVSSMSSWLSQILSIVGNQMTNMQPEQYMIGLAICISLGYVLLRGRN
ncbi:MAG: hypothetical protein ABGZ35_19300 [Planctomycetaceae bacterium]|jgi:hypothetical protein